MQTINNPKTAKANVKGGNELRKEGKIEKV